MTRVSSSHDTMVLAQMSNYTINYNSNEEDYLLINVPVIFVANGRDRAGVGHLGETRKDYQYIFI